MPWCASSPHHVTSIFVPFTATSLLGSGSVGVGLAVEPRFRACFPGPDEPPTSTAVRALRLVQAVDERGAFLAPLPPGKGYAVSAASAVAAALASTRSGGVKTSVLEALQAAHKAEVLERTGLGDVLALSCGVGLVMRSVPGGPGLGRADCVPLPRSVSILSLEAGGSLWTGRLLGMEYLRRYRREAVRAIGRVLEERSLEAFAEESMRYTVTARLDTLVLGESARRILARTPGLIGYYTKKLVTIVLVEADRSGDAVEHLSRVRGSKLRVLAPSERGVEVWWDHGW